MYKYHYINTKTGSSVYSHSELDREDLVLHNKYEKEAKVKTTDFTEASTKPMIMKTPKVYKTRRH